MGDEQGRGAESLVEALDAFALALDHRVQHRGERYARRGLPLAEDPHGEQSVARDEGAKAQAKSSREVGVAAASGQVRPAAAAADPSQWSAGKKLEYLRVRNLGDCQRCDLCKERRQIVFGEGHPEARVMIVGEGPGVDEDRLGRPFVGAAGRRLDQWLEQLGLPREAVYITNVVKCRPPGNRDPAPGEIERCAPFLAAQIRAVAPALIVALGRVAGNHLLGHDPSFGLGGGPAVDPTVDLTVEEMKGRVHAHVEAKSGRRIPLVVVYHPADLPRKARDVDGNAHGQPDGRAGNDPAMPAGGETGGGSITEEAELIDALRAALRAVPSEGRA